MGTLLWLIGSACFIASQPRYLVNPVPGGGVASSSVRDGDDFTAAWALWITASCFWIVGALLSLLTAYVQAAVVTVAGVPRPRLASWLLISAWLQLIAVVLVLVGSAIFGGGSLDDASAGAIVMLLGFTMWGHAVLISYGVSYVVSTTVAFMTSPLERSYAWTSIASLIFVLVQLVLLNLATVLLVVRDPPGMWLTAGLLHLVASVYGLAGWATAIRSSTAFFAPVVLGFATSTALLAPVGGVGAGAALGTTAAGGAVMGGAGPKGGAMAPAGLGGGGAGWRGSAAAPATAVAATAADPGGTVGSTGGAMMEPQPVALGGGGQAGGATAPGALQLREPALVGGSTTMMTSTTTMVPTDSSLPEPQVAV